MARAKSALLADLADEVPPDEVSSAESEVSKSETRSFAARISSTARWPARRSACGVRSRLFLPSPQTVRGLATSLERTMVGEARKLHVLPRQLMVVHLRRRERLGLREIMQKFKMISPDYKEDNGSGIYSL